MQYQHESWNCCQYDIFLWCKNNKIKPIIRIHSRAKLRLIPVHTSFWFPCTLLGLWKKHGCKFEGIKSKNVYFETFVEYKFFQEGNRNHGGRKWGGGKVRWSRAWSRIQAYHNLVRRWVSLCIAFIARKCLVQLSPAVKSAILLVEYWMLLQCSLHHNESIIGRAQWLAVVLLFSSTKNNISSR